MAEQIIICKQGLGSRRVCVKITVLNNYTYFKENPMIIALILAAIFVPLLFLMGIKTGMEQADNKWIKVMKENSTDSQQTITKLQNKLKQKNEELTKLKEQSKDQAKVIEAITSDLNTQRSDNAGLKTRIKKLNDKVCVDKDGIVIDDNGKYHCPIVYKHENKPPQTFL